MAARWGDPEYLTVGDHQVKVSNPERPYFPESGITKLEVVGYYAEVAPVILRALYDRPTTLERWPSGVHPGIRMADRADGRGQAFYQKRVPAGAPDYVETVRITFPSGRTADEVCPTEEAVVVWAANLGTITFHPWPVRRRDVDAPDELRLDFDPQPGAGFADVVRVASEARSVLDELGWAGFPKTSGGRGVHVYVRIQPRWTFTDLRHAAIALGRELQRRLPDLVTLEWWRKDRPEGTVFVDYNQNSRDRTIASAWSVRARPGAPVSTPVTWTDLAELEPEDLTVRTVPGFLAANGDAHADLDRVHHDLTPLLEWYRRDEVDHGLADLPHPIGFPARDPDA